MAQTRAKLRSRIKHDHGRCVAHRQTLDRLLDLERDIFCAASSAHSSLEDVLHAFLTHSRVLQLTQPWKRSQSPGSGASGKRQLRETKESTSAGDGSVTDDQDDTESDLGDTENEKDTKNEIECDYTANCDCPPNFGCSCALIAAADIVIGKGGKSGNAKTAKGRRSDTEEIRPKEAPEIDGKSCSMNVKGADVVTDNAQKGCSPEGGQSPMDACGDDKIIEPCKFADDKSEEVEIMKSDKTEVVQTIDDDISRGKDDAEKRMAENGIIASANRRDQHNNDHGRDSISIDQGAKSDTDKQHETQQQKGLHQTAQVRSIAEQESQQIIEGSSPVVDKANTGRSQDAMEDEMEDEIIVNTSSSTGSQSDGDSLWGEKNFRGRDDAQSDDEAHSTEDAPINSLGPESQSRIGSVIRPGESHPQPNAPDSSDKNDVEQRVGSNMAGEGTTAVHNTRPHVAKLLLPGRAFAKSDHSALSAETLESIRRPMVSSSRSDASVHTSHTPTDSLATAVERIALGAPAVLLALHRYLELEEMETEAHAANPSLRIAIPQTQTDVPSVQSSSPSSSAFSLSSDTNATTPAEEGSPVRGRSPACKTPRVETANVTLEYQQNAEVSNNGSDRRGQEDTPTISFKGTTNSQTNSQSVPEHGLNDLWLHDESILETSSQYGSHCVSSQISSVFPAQPIPATDQSLSNPHLPPSIPFDQFHQIGDFAAQQLSVFGESSAFNTTIPFDSWSTDVVRGVSGIRAHESLYLPSLPLDQQEPYHPSFTKSYAAGCNPQDIQNNVQSMRPVHMSAIQPNFSQDCGVLDDPVAEATLAAMLPIFNDVFPHSDDGGELVAAPRVSSQTTSGDKIERPHRRLTGVFKDVAFDAPLQEQIAGALEVLSKYSEDGQGLDVTERTSIFSTVRHHLTPGTSAAEDSYAWTEEHWMTYIAKADSGAKKAMLARSLCYLGYHQSNPRANDKKFGVDKLEVSKEKKTKTQYRLSRADTYGKKILGLVEAYGLGILLSPHVEALIKGPRTTLQDFVDDIEKANPSLKVLLRLLETQVEAIQCGSRAKYEDFWDQIPEVFGDEVHHRLQPCYAPENVLVVSEWILTKAVNDLIEHYRSRLASTAPKSRKDDPDRGFQHHRATFGTNDLERLHPNRKFNNFLMLAAMNLARTESAEVGPSIEIGNSRGTVNTSYFKHWIYTIETNRRRRDDTQCIHLCPVLYKGHFHLLEVNDCDKKISLYDSTGKNRSSTYDPVLKRIKTDFKNMIDEGYTITRAPCPQQMDDTSCGALAVSMAIRRMNGQQLGGWDDPVMPTRIRLDILQLFDQCKDVAHVDLPLCIAVPPKEDPCDIIEVKQDVVLGVPATPTSPLKRKFSNGELNARSTRMRPGS